MKAAVPEILLFDAPFYFVRHGESESNLDDTIAGWRDVALTDRGRAQAREAAMALRGRGIGAIYSSALSRARDTANEIGQVLELPVHIVAELAERSWGELEGRPRRLRKPGDTPAGAETPDTFANRIVAGFEKVAHAPMPLIVSHAGVFRTLCTLLRIRVREERVGNGQPVRFLPPNAQTPIWQLDFIARSENPPRLELDA